MQYSKKLTTKDSLELINKEIKKFGFKVEEKKKLFIVSKLIESIWHERGIYHQKRKALIYINSLIKKRF